MGKVLIADTVDGFRDQLGRLLAAKHQTICASNGMQAWALFMQFQPDLLVMDLELPQMDGMTLLRRIHDAGFCPAVIIVARWLSDYAVDMLIQMKSGYVLRKPCKPEVVAEQVETLMQYHALGGSPVRLQIAALLREFYIPVDYDGGKYLVSAIWRVMQNPSQYITKELYPSVAKEYGRDIRSVERSMRHAIEVGWKKGGQAVWERYFGAETGDQVKRPRNSDLISAMVELLKSRL